ILEARRPQAFLLENVKNLLSNDKKKTITEIMRTLREDLGYHAEYYLVDGALRVPQHRERVYIIGFRDPTDFTFPDISEDRPELTDILDPDPPEKYILSEGLWEY